MNTIRWGIIGVGRFGKIHARVLASLPGSEVVALSARRQEMLVEVAAEFGVSDEKCYTNFHQLLADPDIDAVSITTHWQQHHEVAMAALASGKHVLLEKPMAASVDECREVMAAAQAASGVFMVGHVCRFDPRVTLAKQAIDEGRIGRIVSMHARRNLPKAPGNIRLDKISPLIGDGIHDADLMMWFLGRAPSQVYGRTVKVDDFDYADLGWAMLHFDQEAIGVVETVWCLPENVPTVIDAKLEVIGTDGMLSIDCANTGLTILDSNGAKKPDTAFWPEQHGRLVGALANELGYFAECIRRDESPSVITAEEAGRAFAVMAAAERSAELGLPVDFEFPANS